MPPDLPPLSDADFPAPPQFSLRGTAIGLQKTYILPGRKVYEYPITPELFPWFYDREHWRRYLDALANWRFNTLYLWSGHPFASLVRTPGFEDCIEVAPDQLDRNIETYRWLADECGRRGIWLIQNFYSLLLPKPLAEKHGLDTQLPAPLPVASEYTRAAIAEFVFRYPNVGLLVCLGEALQGLDNQVSWMNEVILAGVKQALARAGRTDLPPVIVRAHATDPSVIMPAALKVYPNLYTMAKYNGESLTTHEPRGKRQQVHLAMSRLGSTHLVNVHILANLEPFRYGATEFIRRCVVASRDRLGARGVHLYPLAFWSWPHTPDATEPPLEQLDRDWIWYESWGRYAWNPDRDPDDDRVYWVTRLTRLYGADAAADILDAYNFAGEVAPRLLRRFGITEGNRQTLSLGMTLEQLVDPQRHRPFPELWESQAPPGERLQEYVAREFHGQSHEGETPPQVLEHVLDFSARAVEAIERAAPRVERNHDEFARLRNDVHCVRAMTLHYAEKVRSAMLVLRHRLSRDPSDLDRALLHLHRSVEQYRELARLTATTYRFANTMQTSQRRVPLVGRLDDQPAYYHWTQVLPVFETELSEFAARVQRVREGRDGELDESTIERLPKRRVTLRGDTVEQFDVQVGSRVFKDRDWTIRSIAPELAGLVGLRVAFDDATSRRLSPIEFEAAEPVKLLVGYFRDDGPRWMKPPDLETDALAGEFGGTEPLILNAADVASLPPIDVHAWSFPAGRNRLDPRGQGAFVVLGITCGNAAINRRDARRGVGPDGATP